MTTQATIGYGSKMSLGNGGSPETFAELAEVMNITPPGMSMDAVDATHNQSPSGAREFIPGLIDAGEVSFEMNFVPGSAADSAVRTWLAARAAKNARITFPDGATTCTFAALLTGYEPAAPMEDKMTATVTVKVSGLPVWA